MAKIRSTVTKVLWGGAFLSTLVLGSCDEQGSAAQNGPDTTEAAAPAPKDSLLEAVRNLPPAERLRMIKMEIDEGHATKQRYFQLGNAYYESGDPAGAVNAFNASIAMDSTYFKAMVNLALMYDEQQNYAKAIEIFEGAIEIDSDNPDAWSHLGNTYYAQRLHSKAMEQYRQALSLDPEATHALYSIGVAFADAGIFREAVEYWGRVNKLEPESELGKSAAENVELLQKYLIPSK